VYFPKKIKKKFIDVIRIYISYYYVGVFSYKNIFNLGLIVI
jgi:hypothetical protein